MQTIARS